MVGLFCANRIYGQTTIDVADNTLKVAGLGEEVFYYGFAEGDQLIFNFQEINGKELKELEIIELPSSSKFMDYKTTKIENKTISITETGIYKFRFSNSAVSGRICKFKIQRIPASDATKNFNTSVYIRTVYDTTYKDIQEEYLVKSDTVVSTLIDNVTKVHSSTNSEGNKTKLNFILPVKTIAWSYYIGVDQAGQQALKDATEKLAKTAGSTLISLNPLAGLALYGTASIMKLQSGENVEYWLTDATNASLMYSGQAFKYYKTGNVINDFAKMITPMSGQLFLCLMNDNNFQAIDVTIQVTAISINEQWGTRTVKKMNVNSRQEQYLKN